MDLSKPNPDDAPQALWVVAIFLIFATISVLILQPSPPEWRTEKKKDPISDVVNIEATLRGYYAHDSGTITLSCSTNKPEILGYVEVDQAELLEEVSYAVRFDDAVPIVGTITSDSLRPVVKIDQPFVKRLARSEKLAYRVNDDTVVFDTSEAEAAIEQLHQTCRSKQ